MRITLLIITGFLVIAGAGFFLLLKAAREDVERQYSQAAEEPLVDFAYLLAGVLEQDVVDGEIDLTAFRAGFSSAYEREFEAKIYQLVKSQLQTHVYVTDANGLVLFDSDGGKNEGEDFSEMNDVVLTLRGDYGVRASRTDPEDSRTTVFHVAAPILDQGETIGVLAVARPETALSPFAEETRASFLKWSIIAATMVIVLGSAWTYWLMSPIGEITAFARRVEAGKRVAEAPRAGRAELRELSSAVDAMRRELEGRHYVENYVQALTHEIKSPLAAIRGASELLAESGDTMPEADQAKFLGNIQAETDRAERIVRRLVQLAALESQTALESVATLDLSELVRDELENSEDQACSKGLTFETSGLDAATKIEGDELVLRMAVRNLLANAIEFSPNGGLVRLELSTEPTRLEVIDDGPGVPDYALDRVFDRFYSLKHETTGRKSSGLGLCFVREAMALHGGAATVENRSDGSGLRAVLSFG